VGTKRECPAAQAAFRLSNQVDPAASKPANNALIRLALWRVRQLVRLPVTGSSWAVHMRCAVGGWVGGAHLAACSALPSSPLPSSPLSSPHLRSSRPCPKRPHTPARTRPASPAAAAAPSSSPQRRRRPHICAVLAQRLRREKRGGGSAVGVGGAAGRVASRPCCCCDGICGNGLVAAWCFVFMPVRTAEARDGESKGSEIKPRQISFPGRSIWLGMREGFVDLERMYRMRVPYV